MKNEIITTAAEKFAARIGFKSASIWTKKGTRLYLNGYGYDTKKCKQSVYIDLDTFQVKCFTECPSQTYQWCISQSNEVMNSEVLNAFARLLRITCKG